MSRILLNELFIPDITNIILSYKTNSPYQKYRKRVLINFIKNENELFQHIEDPQRIVIFLNNIFEKIEINKMISKMKSQIFKMRYNKNKNENKISLASITCKFEHLLLLDLKMYNKNIDLTRETRILRNRLEFVEKYKDSCICLTNINNRCKNKTILNNRCKTHQSNNETAFNHYNNLSDKAHLIRDFFKIKI